MSTARKPRLNEDQRKILGYLSKAAADGEGNLVHVGELQRNTVLFIRGPLESLKCRGLVDHDGALPFEARYWKITDAGNEALR